MFNVTMIGLAFLSGCMACMIGGTFTFIIYGILGILGMVATYAGVDMTWFNTVVMGTFFVPAVCFNATVPATALASLRYDIKGYEITKSLAFTHDFMIILFGGLAGIFGYLALSLVAYLNIPCDQGAFTIITTGILYRVIFNRGQQYSKDGLRLVKHGGVMFWGYEIMIGLTLAAVAAYFVEMTGNVSVGFYASATILLLQFIDPYVPCTHQITMVAGYAMVATHSIVIAMVFGLIAEIINTVFGLIFNTDCGTHIDPPGLAIVICSFIINLIF